MAAPAVVNVKDPPYNAKGDGVTDDTAAIKAAISAAWGGRSGTSAASGGTVYFPPGTYRITSTIDLTDKNLLHLLGGSGRNVGAFCLPPQAALDGTSITSGPAVKLSSSDGSARGGNNTLENLDIAGGDIAVLVTDTAQHFFRNCGFHAAPRGATDNAAVVVANAFWVRFEQGAATAAPGKPAMILRGKAPAKNANVTYLIEIRKFVFNGGGIRYTQDTSMTGSVPNHFMLDCVTSENLPAGTPLFDITKLNSGIAWMGCRYLTFLHCDNFDAGGAAPLLRLNRGLGGGDAVQGVTMIGGNCPGYVPIQVAGGLIQGVSLFNFAGASVITDAGGNPTAKAGGMWVGESGITFLDLSQAHGTVSTTDLQSYGGPATRWGKAGDRHASGGIDGGGTHYWGPGGRTGGWDVRLHRIAAGVLGVSGAAFTIPVTAADPPNPANGMIWYNSSSHSLRCCVNGAVKSLAVT